jgi:DNA-binding transcriptional regulator YhcF (GntR family)
VSSNGSIGGATPEYRRVADALRADIETGALAAGDQLPSHAQLVKRFAVSRHTVQHALKELQEAGFVESAQGRGVFVADARSRTAASQADEAVSPPDDLPAVELEDIVAKAFEAERITIDAFCLTAESLFLALGPQVRRIQRHEVSPKSIKVRLILPRIDDVRLAIPRLVDDPTAADKRPRDRLANLIDVHTAALQNIVEDLKDQPGPLEEAVVETKMVPLTPVFKSYLFNGRWGLTGYYSVIPRRVHLLDGQQAEIFDVLGVGARLFQQGPSQLETCQQWFDSLWETIAWDTADTPGRARA